MLLSGMKKSSSLFVVNQYLRFSPENQRHLDFYLHRNRMIADAESLESNESLPTLLVALQGMLSHGHGVSAAFIILRDHLNLFLVSG